jgi:hypothetical protein
MFMLTLMRTIRSDQVCRTERATAYASATLSEPHLLDLVMFVFSDRQRSDACANPNAR